MQDLPPLAHILADARIAALVAAPSPAFLIDSGGRLHFANRSALALLGARTLAEAVARGPEILGPLAEAVRELVPTLSPTGAPRIEHLRAPDESTIVFATTRFSLGNAGDAALLVGIDTGRDRTLELRLAVAALIDGEREAMALLDSGGHLIHANASAAAAFDKARSLSDLDPAAPAALANVLRDDAAVAGLSGQRVMLRRIDVGTASAILAVFAPGGVQHREFPATVEMTPRGPALPLPGRTPSRFVWQMDASGRFTSVSPDLAAVVGPDSAAIMGLDWPAVAAKLGLRDNGTVSAAVARRDTWSGVSVLWPVAGTDLARPVDLAALPVFDRERNFLGYRGFGVFHDPVPRPAGAEIAKSKPHSAPREGAAQRPPLALVEQPENVVPLRSAGSDALRRPVLTSGERNAFREIARVLGAGLEKGEARKPGDAAAPPEPPAPAPAETVAEVPAFTRTVANGERAVLDRLPLGVVVHRGEQVLYANRMALEWTGLPSIEALNQAGGLRRLFAGASMEAERADEAGRAFTITGRGGEPIPVEARLLSAPWDGEIALVYVLRRAGAGLDERIEAAELALRGAEATARELRAILDTATDGVLLLDREGRVLGMNRSAEALFGFDADEVEGQAFTMLFAPESRRAATDYLDGLASGGVASVLNDGREVLGRVREGGLIPLFMTMGRVGDGMHKFCAVFRDISQWKRAEQELLTAKREAEKASSQKSDFLAKVSHEIRTPLNAIIGFAEVMAEQRFGPIGNERYREYLKDIQASGAHLISLINDLLDLSKIEAGKLDLSFASVDLNDIASQCMAIMQPQANRERIIIRTSLAPHLPPVVADARSIRQIVLNLLSNSIKFTPPGGQVIVSTALADTGEVTLRVRDTGVGMSEAELKIALEPFRQIATSGRTPSAGSGLGLPLTKALAEANRANFTIKSAHNAGTLVEITFPTTRVLAE
jgi:PAS domain S-box-containing protein